MGKIKHSYSASDAVLYSDDSLIVQGLIDIASFGYPGFNSLISNHFIEDTLKKVNAFNKTDTKQVVDLRNYIAASTLIHSFDSWNYIARGVASILQGDIHTAVHLIYYSEVRSAMSILASSGIGIFNYEHWFLDKHGIFQSFGDGTHVVIDNCMNEFETGLNTRLRAFFSSINFNSINLEQFILQSGLDSTGALSSSYFKGLLKEWSIDLKLKLDQDERNVSSYRPNFQREKVTKSLLTNLVDIWTDLDPNIGQTFENLDRYIGLMAIKKLSKSQKKKLPDFLTDTLQYYTSATSLPAIQSILPNGKIYKPLIFKMAEKDTRNRKVNFKSPLPMLCRSILLARIATGLVENKLRDPNFRRTGLDLWWRETAIKLGIVNSKNSVRNSTDLWNDVEDAIKNVNGNVSRSFGIKAINDTNAKDLVVLSQFQRVAFWGLGL